MGNAASHFTSSPPTPPPATRAAKPGLTNPLAREIVTILETTMPQQLAVDLLRRSCDKCCIDTERLDLRDMASMIEALRFPLWVLLTEDQRADTTARLRRLLPPGGRPRFAARG